MPRVSTSPLHWMGLSVGAIRMVSSTEAMIPRMKTKSSTKKSTSKRCSSSGRRKRKRKVSPSRSTTVPAARRRETTPKSIPGRAKISVDCR